MAKQPQSCAFRTSIGGQALIEGILMRGPEKQAIVVRDQEGNLVEKVGELRLIKDRHPILGWPLIRGTVNFLSSMVNGVKALMYSADFYPEEETTEPSKFEQWLDRTFSNKKLEGLIVGLSVLLGIGLSIFLFLVLPTFLTGGLLHFFPDFPMWGRNLIEGVLKVAIFLLYLIFCSKQKDIYRVFQYHGAEHKTIFCYEAGLPLTVENVRIQPRHHPRCGTSFLFVVIFVSILVSSVVFGIWPITNVWLRTLAHLILLPLVVGITYEFNRWVGRHVQDSRLAKILTAPGMWMQNFTTNEPDDSMIECAIRSLELVLPVLWRRHTTICIWISASSCGGQGSRRPRWRPGSWFASALTRAGRSWPGMGDCTPPRSWSTGSGTWCGGIWRASRWHTLSVSGSSMGSRWTSPGTC